MLTWLFTPYYERVRGLESKIQRQREALRQAETCKQDYKRSYESLYKSFREMREDRDALIRAVIKLGGEPPELKGK